MDPKELTEGRLQRSNLEGSELRTLVTDLQDPGEVISAAKKAIDLRFHLLDES